MTPRMRIALAILLLPTLLGALPPGEEDRDLPVGNWTVPPYWSPGRAGREVPAEPLPERLRHGALTPADLTAPMPFVAVAPCRIVNTRRASTGEFDAPALVALTERTFTLPNGPCPGLPAEVGAWSLNVTVVPAGLATLGGYLSVYPAGGARPIVSTLNFLAGSTAPPVANAAIVPAGLSGAITVFASDATHLLIDVNGYYAESGVTSVFGRAGAVVAATGDYAAAQVENSPSGSVAARNLQSAINELDSEKAPLAHSHSRTGITGLASGGIVYGDASGNLQQDYKYLFWDTATNRLGLGLTTPQEQLELTGNLRLRPTEADGASGILKLGDGPFLHGFTPGTSTARNTFLGFDAGNLTMGGYDPVSGSGGVGNVGLGNLALNEVTTGSQNTAVGDRALKQTTTGYWNVGVGRAAMFDNTGGRGNVAVGTEALIGNEEGSFNVAVGFSVMSLAEGDENVAIGFDALGILSAGSGNLALGTEAGYSLGIGSDNIYVGANAGAYQESSTIRIGRDGVHTAAFLQGISGRTSTDGVAVYVNGSGKLGTLTSSRRFKREIVDVGAESDVLMKLRPVAFRYRPELDPESRQQYGLVAEEVAEVAPDLVVYSRDGQVETVRYHLVNALMLNELQKQRRAVGALEAALQAQEEEIRVLRSLVEQVLVDRGRTED